MKNHNIRISQTILCLLLLLAALLLTGCSSPGSWIDGILQDAGVLSPDGQTENTDTLSPDDKTKDTGTMSPDGQPSDADAASPGGQSPDNGTGIPSSSSKENAPPDDPASQGPSEEGGKRPESSSSASPEILALLDGIVSPSMSEYEKVKAIHDYLVIHVNYDYENLSAGTLPDSAFTADGALLMHSAVCEGYAKAFSLLCDLSGVENTLVYGTADDGTGVQSHAWNQVRIDGAWYNMDVTWDDPLMNGRVVTDGSNMIYDYFLVPDTVLAGNHTAESSDKLQVCNSDQYMEQNRRMTIEAWLTEPCTFTDSDGEVQTAVGQYLSDGVLEFQLVCDAVSHDPEERSDFVLNQVKETMEALGLYGQISVETQYGIADYAVIDVTVTR